MKKVVLALAVVFSVALVSCSNKEKAAEDTVVADTTEMVEDTNKATEEVADTNKAADEAPVADSNKAEEAPAQ